MIPVTRLDGSPFIINPTAAVRFSVAKAEIGDVGQGASR